MSPQTHLEAFATEANGSDGEPDLTGLSTSQRAVYVAVEINGIAPKDHGEAVGISASAARTHLQRARKKIEEGDA